MQSICVGAKAVHVQGNKGGIMDVAIRKLSEKNRTLMIYMFNTAYCIMKEELPYTLLFYSMNGHC
jgi:hypothetical protein